MFSNEYRDRRKSVLVALASIMVVTGCTTNNVDFASVRGLPPETIDERVSDSRATGEAAVGAAIAGLPDAVWADENNDGYVDGYIYNGQYYAGTPQGYDPSTHSVLSGAATGALGGAALGSVAGAVIPGVSVLQGAVIGAATGGLAGAIWADRNNDGVVDGYVYNGQYYAGSPSPAATGSPSYASLIRRRHPECEGLPRLSLSPPQPSAAPVTLDNGTFAQFRTSLRYVAGQLVTALHLAGYEEQSFYCVPGGFALATAIERIEPDTKRPYPGDARWNLERIPLLSLNNGFSLGDLLKAFKNADAGSYRMIIFYVTDQPLVPVTAVPLANFRNLPRGGPDELPRQWRNTAYTDQHRVRALLYEFKRQSVSSPIYFVTPTLPAALQLRRTGILKGLHR